MTAYYFDSSALIKRYVTEIGSRGILNLFQPDADHFFVTSRLTMTEIYSALNRRRREESVSIVDYQINAAAFKRDSSVTYQFIELTLDVVDLSRSLLEQHPLRANDAIQLASALLANHSLTAAGLAPLAFLSADNRLSQVAGATGLSVINPSDLA
jgi:predicted nucleic acid-binding protein